MGAARAGWEHFDHGADIGIRGRGPSPAVAFAQAALALTAVITDPERVAPLQELAITCEAEGLDDLFFDWLDAIVFEMSTRKMLFGRFDVVIEGGRLRARIFGEPVDRARHEPAVEVKGPTYTELCVAWDSVSGEWRAQCIVDV